MAAKSLMDALVNFDPNEVITKALAASAPKIVKLAASQARKTPDALAHALGLGYHHHLQATYDRCYSIKTLIYRDEPVPLLNQYVSIKLGLKKAKISDNVLISRLEDFKNIIVQGSGGSGKTMFMKYLALCRFENPKGRIPLFIEMRSLDYRQGKTIEQLIYEYSTSKKSRVTFEQFQKSLINGIFLIILDGMDEVDPEHRLTIHKQVIDMPVNYPDNLLIITSREDPSLGGWGPFYNFSVLPLDKRQVTNVIKKIDFDGVIKQKFLKELSSSLYEKHKSFLTNPLLATIMLLRYDQFASSSDKIYIFYDQAFETLFFKHDISKGVYERKRYTGITVDEFKKLFAAFSFSSYRKNKYSFTRAEIILFIEKALSYCKLQASPSLVLRDLMESLCIIQEDGLFYTFVHRSFQEYFAALFVSEYRGSQTLEYVNDIMSRNYAENAGRLLKEMSPKLVQRYWALPTLEKIASIVTDKNIENDPGMLANQLWGRLWCDKDGSVNGYGIGDIGIMAMSLDQYYAAGLSAFFQSDILFSSKEDVVHFPDKFDGQEKNAVRAIVTPILNARPMTVIDLASQDGFWLRKTRVIEELRDLATRVGSAKAQLEVSVSLMDQADQELL